MRTEYKIDDTIITIGMNLEVVGRGPCKVTGLYPDRIRVLDGAHNERHIDASAYPTMLPTLTWVRLPEVGYFDRYNGEPLVSGMRIAGGTVEGVYPDVLRFERESSDGYYRFVEIDPSVENLSWGVEIRIHPTSDELLYGLPRETGDDCSYCVRVNGELKRAEDVVWLDGAYHLLSECSRLAGFETRLILDTTGTVPLADGRLCYENEAARVTSGPRTGEYMYMADVRPTEDGHVVPVSEAVTLLDDCGRQLFSSGVPAVGWVELSAGVWAHENNIRECGRTGEIMHSCNARALDNGDTVSAAWAEEHARSCSECGALFEDSENPEGECPRCRSQRRTRIRNYSNRSASFFRPEEDIPLRFGIELEVGCDRGYARSECAEVMADAIDKAGVPVEQYAVFKEDGSLSDCNGFEIVTRPDSPAVHKRIWSSVLAESSITRHMSSFNNGKCGIHIHVSRAPLTELWIGRLLVLVNSDETRPMVHKIAGRGMNDYTRYYQKKLTSGRRQNGERYESLNTTSGETIEFRVFRGTLNRDSFLKNIEFVEAALAFTRPCAHSLQKMNSPESFIDFVSKERKQFPHLHLFLQTRVTL